MLLEMGGIQIFIALLDPGTQVTNLSSIKEDRDMRYRSGLRCQKISREVVEAKERDEVRHSSHAGNCIGTRENSNKKQN